MSVQTGPSRPATKSVGAAVVGLVLTLGILVVALLSFLIAPLAALGVAYLVYAGMRSRGAKRSAPRGPARPGAGGPTEDQPGRTSPGTFGFGAGTSP